MDGFTLLRIIMTACPTPVIVVSSHSEDERVFKALELGAVDFVAKPRRALSEQLLEIRDELQQKVGALLNINLQGLKKRTQHVDPAESLPVKKVVKLPRSGNRKFDAVAIGSSTGGPPALQKILLQMPADLPFTIFISQHMPSGFTRTFAERLNRMLPFEVKEAVDGDVVLPNQVLVAPGGVNMITVQMRDQVIVRLKAPTKDEKYVPSVNAMLNSVARVYGNRTLAVILTGMGNDGSIGVRKVKEAGGAVIAEAEDSSVVFGMPREAIATGVVDKIVHLDQMASKILEFCGFR
jgi:two-component system chemotaxis response regulator CheB